MITKDLGSPAAGRWFGLLAVAASLLLGILVGTSLDADRPLGDAPPPTPPATGELEGPFARAGPGDPAPAKGLPRLQISIAEADARTLQGVRDVALERGVIRGRDEVPATLTVEGRSVPATVRIKGDWTDHVDTDKWSLRIEAEGSVFGMSRFSIQHPKTRTWLLEWLILEAARREGLLAPRAMFVDVVVNDRPSGIYFLEEHFTKEMLESQGRRDGPVVRFDEEALWRIMVQFKVYIDQLGAVPRLIHPAMGSHRAVIDAYDEKRLGKVDELNERLHRALEQLRAVQRKIIAAADGATDLMYHEELVASTGQEIDGLFDVERLGRFVALCGLFEARHGLVYNQWRFYHDPVHDRLEPVAFDTLAPPGAQTPPPVLAAFDPLLNVFLSSDRYYEAFLRSTSRLASPGYVEGLLASVGDEYRRLERLLAAEFELPGWTRLAGVSKKLLAKRDVLAELMHPGDLLRLNSAVVYPETGATQAEPQAEHLFRPVAGTVEVEAWCSTRMPVVIEAFRFSNGSEVPAGDAVVTERFRRGPREVVLPFDGRHVRFSFPLDARLSYLRDVQGVKQAVREQIDPDRNVKVEITAVFRSVVDERSSEQQLVLRRRSGSVTGAAGRPPAPDLAGVLARHAFLAYDTTKDVLGVQAGDWTVKGDLVLPAGRALQVRGGATLRFEPGAVMLVTGELELSGGGSTGGVSLLPLDESAGWSGLVVLDAPGRSRLTGVTIRGTRGISRGPWQSPGGVTFYGSAVEMRDCRIENSLGEDALNIFGSDFLLHGVTLEGAASDLYDGDFVTGEVVDCTFGSSGEDAVDVSGSEVTVRGCRFVDIGDKALSVGERSTLTATGNRVESASIAVACKDDSTVVVEDLVVGTVENFVYAAYVKKAEYGPSRITASGTTGPGAAGASLCQVGCELTVDGRPVPGEEVDVEALYASGVLGK